MNIEKLFKKVEKLFALDDNAQKKKEHKSDKLESELLKKIGLVKKELKQSKRVAKKRNWLKS